MNGLLREGFSRRTGTVTDRELLRRIERIQQEWWDGDVEMNVAMSEIRSLFRFWNNPINPIGCEDKHLNSEYDPDQASGTSRAYDNDAY